MKVLFLDIDGVLNSYRTVLTTGNCPHPHNYRERREQFDWTAIKMLRGLCGAGGIKIVLSSSWRIGMTREWLDEFADFLGLPVIDATPNSRKAGEGRGHEIKEWLDNHAEVTHYGIVDDDSDMLPEQKPQFAHTHFADGLTWEPFATLCRIFGIGPWDCKEHACGVDSSSKEQPK